MADPGFAVDVDPAVHQAHPDYVTLVVVASGLLNGPSDAESDTQLAAAEAHLRASGLLRATDHPHIAAWRKAFSGFGAKPSRYPSSAEALIAWVLKGQALPRVNALVDLYNAISVRHVAPLGGEDADRLEGPLRLTVAAGGESFDPSGRNWTSSRSPPARASGVMSAASPVGAGTGARDGAHSSPETRRARSSRSNGSTGSRSTSCATPPTSSRPCCSTAGPIVTSTAWSAASHELPAMPPRGSSPASESRHGEEA